MGTRGQGSKPCERTSASTEPATAPGGSQHHRVVAARPGHWNADVTHQRPGRRETMAPKTLPTLRKRWPGTGASTAKPSKPLICTLSPSSASAASAAAGHSNHRSLTRATAT
eukprot:7994498-Alexandrium_andersonii.AAC.1